MTKLKDFIVRTYLENTDENQKLGNADFDTQDYIFFETFDEVSNLTDFERVTYATDYAIMNGAYVSDTYGGPKKDRHISWFWLRQAESKDSVHSVIWDGSYFNFGPDTKSAVICPSLHLNLATIIAKRNESRDFKIKPFRKESGDVLYYTIEFGSYPQDKAKNNDELERLFNARKLTPTGKTYSGYMKEDGSFQQNKEFEYAGKKYVRVITKPHYKDSEYKDKIQVQKFGAPVWAEVQPIRWKIKNWDELPRSINPNGSGTAKTIYVKSEEGIVSGIPFYPHYGDDKSRDTMWQNSVIRAYLNGYNLYNEIDSGNGNEEYKNDENFNFDGNGFLQEAFVRSLSRTFTVIQKDEKEFQA